MPSHHETLLDMNSLIKRRVKKSKAGKGKKKKEVFSFYEKDKNKINQQEKKIKSIEKRNRQIDYNVKKLKKEQISRGTPKERVRQIDKMLKSSDYNKISLEPEKNYLKQIKGENFYYIVDNGFKRRKIKASTLAKVKNPSLYFSKQLEKDITQGIKSLEQQLKSKKITKGAKKELNKKLFVFDPKKAAWAAYNAEGFLVKTGEASGGR